MDEQEFKASSGKDSDDDEEAHLHAREEEEDDDEYIEELCREGITPFISGVGVDKIERALFELISKQNKENELGEKPVISIPNQKSKK